MVEAVVLPKISAKLPMYPVEFEARWKHLSDLHLADPDFGVPDYADILLEVDIFHRAVRHGWQLGPPGSPSAVDTCFGWALSGSFKHRCLQQVVACSSPLLVGNNLLQKFGR